MLEQAPLYLLTRFNVRFEGVGSLKRLDPSWLNERFDLFEQVCLPSVQGQSVLPTGWLVFFDAQTPAIFKQRIAALACSFPCLRPIYCDEFSVAFAAQQLRAMLLPGTEWVVTTRLDSDDGLHRDFLAVVAAAVVPGREQFLNPTQGLVIHGECFYRKRDYSSPFLSFSESAQHLRTVWLEQHHLAGRHAPVHQLPLRDAWLQLVHGGNVANQVRGVRADPRSIDGATLPEGLSRRLSPATLAELLLDNSLGLLNRYARSAWRRARTELRVRLSR